MGFHKAARRVRVLEAIPDPARTKVSNPYTSLLAASLPADRVEVCYFSWPRAIFAKYEIAHIHWPEQLVRHPNPAKRTVKQLMALLFLGRLRFSRIPLVRTAHNVRPHEQGSPVEGWLLDRFDGATTTWIVMNEETKVPENKSSFLIPHGHYRGWFGDSGRIPEVGRLLSFGLIRPYKGTEQLIRAFSELQNDDLKLHIVGKPSTEELRVTILAATADNERIATDLRFVSDEDLADAVRDAEIVVLPYTQMNNSGAALLALSLNRPVLLPTTAATIALQSEFGTQWVSLFDGELDATVLQHGIEEIRSTARNPDGPDMSRRDWRPLGERLADVFVSAAR